jgi:membrane fusion protein, multidrug efflux system
VVEDVVVTVSSVAVRVAPGLCVMLALACGGERGSASSQQTAIQRGDAAAAEFTVDTATVQLPLEFPAQLYVEHDAVVVARSAGTVDSIFVELGDHVSAGQTLARLESSEQEISLANAEATYDNLARIAVRARTLTKSGSTTAADSEQVEFQLRQADIARRKARRDVELTRIIAPFDGVVSARSVRLRRFAAVGDSLFRVTEPSPLLARIRVPEASARLIRSGASAQVVATGGTSAATIVHVAPIIDAASGTREVVLKIDRPAANLLAGANVVVRVGRDWRRVVTVAREAIATEGYALVVENGRTSTRAVILGASLDGGRVEVLSGLSPGERLARPAR